MSAANDQHLERDNARLRNALRHLITRARSCAKEIQAEAKLSGESNAAKRVHDQAILLEAAAIVAETVFKSKS